LAACVGPRLPGIGIGQTALETVLVELVDGSHDLRVHAVLGEEKGLEGVGRFLEVLFEERGGHHFSEALEILRG